MLCISKKFIYEGYISQKSIFMKDIYLMNMNAASFKARLNILQ